MNEKKKAKPKMGRPFKPAKDKCSEFIGVKVTKSEKNVLEKEAKRREISVAALLMLPWRGKKK
ncbi:hypothetical protein ACFL54_06270 [Planctomycetota bacterium]